MSDQPVYVDLPYVKAVGSMPAADVDAVVAMFPSTFDEIAKSISAIFFASLHKQYSVFEAPYPEALRWHVAKVVVAELWKKRGYNAGHALDEEIDKDADKAWAWMREAANAKDGLVELPRRADLAGTAGSDRGGPLAQSEASPYEWIDDQAERIGRSR